MDSLKNRFSNKYLTKLIAPLVVSMLLSSSVGIIDTLMISSLSESCISGVSLVDQINVLILNVFAALATGGAVVTSQLIGAKDEKNASKSAQMLIFSALAISLFIAAIGIVFCKGIINLCFSKLDKATHDAAVTYFLVTAFSYPIIAVDSCCGALFRSFGKSNYCMYSALLCNLVNIAGNALTIYVLEWGVFGAALSTLIGRFVGMLLTIFWISGKNSPIRINLFSRFTPDFKMIGRILRIGIPSGLENSFFQLGRLLVVSLIAEYGLVHTTANAMANHLDTFGCIFGSAMNLAVITVIGQCVGARDFDGVKYYAKKLLLIQYAIGSLFYLSTIVFITPILSWFNLDSATTELTRTLVLIHNGVGMFLWPLAFTLPDCLRAANDVRFTMIVAICSMVICRLGLSYFLHFTYHMGALGVWIAMVADWICRLTFFVIRFASAGWKKHCN
ncbi:MAG: MATE family efflux transporter [Ruminococcaceae bacterium]|nr:MATE family efflux transporter [Oscillospiraceae bacterium]